MPHGYGRGAGCGGSRSIHRRGGKDKANSDAGGGFFVLLKSDKSAGTGRHGRVGAVGAFASHDTEGARGGKCARASLRNLRRSDPRRAERCPRQVHPPYRGERSRASDRGEDLRAEPYQGRQGPTAAAQLLGDRRGRDRGHDPEGPLDRDGKAVRRLRAGLCGGQRGELPLPEVQHRAGRPASATGRPHSPARRRIRADRAGETGDQGYHRHVQ